MLFVFGPVQEWSGAQREERRGLGGGGGEVGDGGCCWTDRNSRG